MAACSSKYRYVLGIQGPLSRYLVNCVKCVPASTPLDKSHVPRSIDASLHSPEQICWRLPIIIQVSFLAGILAPTRKTSPIRLGLAAGEMLALREVLVLLGPVGRLV